jgi:hypothetical protein
VTGASAEYIPKGGERLGPGLRRPRMAWGSVSSFAETSLSRFKSAGNLSFVLSYHCTVPVQRPHSQFEFVVESTGAATFRSGRFHSFGLT